MLFRLYRAAAVLLPLAMALPASPQQTAQPRNASSSTRGIEVRGWWKLTTLNADGSVAQHVEFENALTPGGQDAIASLLGVKFTSGGLNIVLGSAQGSGACGSRGCLLYETGTGSRYYPAGSLYNVCAAGQYSCFDTLSDTLTNSLTNITLAGTIHAPQAGSIDQVKTLIGTCTVESSNACRGERGGIGQNFTQASFTPITLTAGQVLQVSVVISFS